MGILSSVRNLIVLCALIVDALDVSKILVAINAGGPEHTDIYGVKYRRDPLTVGTASDHGKRYLIGRVPPEDQILYQTERYHTDNFEYVVELENAVDGDYVLVLKFSEVYFESPNMKVFSVQLNDQTVVKSLDIFALVGKAVAHDEVVPFAVKSHHLVVGDEKVDFDGALTIRFMKDNHDNPKVNALYVLRGSAQDVPELLPLEKMDEEELLPRREEEAAPEEEPEAIEKFASGPQLSDPYAQQEASQMFIPVLVALACFFPVLFCLCRL